MHRIHHSAIHEERDSNFGFLISWWDWIFSTYSHYPKMGERKLVFGVEEFRGKKYQPILGMLLMPFGRFKPPYVRKKAKLMRTEEIPEPKDESEND